MALNTVTGVAFSLVGSAVFHVPPASAVADAALGGALLGGILNLLIINRDLPISRALQYSLAAVKDKPIATFTLSLVERALSIATGLLETAIGHMILKASSEDLAEQLKNQAVGAAITIVASILLALFITCGAAVYYMAIAGQRLEQANDAVADMENNVTPAPPVPARNNVNSIVTIGSHRADSQTLCVPLVKHANITPNAV